MLRSGGTLVIGRLFFFCRDMAPWTAAEAASESVSKKQLITFLQENADAAFLSANKLAGQPAGIVKRVTKDALVASYTKFLGEDGGSAAPGGSPGGFAFKPPAAGEAQPAFSFGAPPPSLGGAAASPAGDSSGFTFNFAAPPPGGKPSAAQIKAMAGGMDDDDDVEDVDTSNMKKKGGGMMGGLPEEMRKRMEQLNMSADERREATLKELPPAIRKRVEGLEKLQESVDELHTEFNVKLQALREEYEKKKAPFFKQRHEVVTASDGGIPNFWLTVLQNNMIIAEEIQKADEDALSHLTDIKCARPLPALSSSNATHNELHGRPDTHPDIAPPPDM